MKKKWKKYRVTPRVHYKNNLIFIKCIIDQNFWSFLYFLLKIGHQVPFITLHVKKVKILLILLMFVTVLFILAQTEENSSFCKKMLYTMYVEF